MRKQPFAVIATLALLVYSIVTFSPVSAEQPPFNFVTPWVWETPPKLIIESPTNGTYIGRVLLNFTVIAPNNWFSNQSEKWNDFNLYNTAIEQKLKSISYVMDGNLTTVPVESNLYLPYQGSIEFANLTEGTHQIIVFTNSTGVYRSFRGYFVETQINNSNKTVIDLNFVPASTPSPNAPANSRVQLLDTGIVLVIVLLVIGCLLLFRRYRKTLNSTKMTFPAIRRNHPTSAYPAIPY